MTRTTLSNEPPCPIWQEPPALREMPHGGRLCNSPRAGGRFLLEYDGAVLLQRHVLTDRRRANLSYWIYKHNLENHLFDESPADKPLVLDKKWVVDHRDLTPSAEDRMLNFLRELIRFDDAGEPPQTSEEYSSEWELLLAAGGCRNGNDRKELENYAATQGWMVPADSDLQYSTRINLGARLYVEERTRKLDRGRQGFVAMWFNSCMDEAYKLGIQPAIRDAGYEPRLINEGVHGRGGR